MQRDHLRDIFESLEAVSETPRAQLVVRRLLRACCSSHPVSAAPQPGATLFVTRERGEHVNMYHSMTDFFNAFMTIEMIDVDPRSVRLTCLVACGR